MHKGETFVVSADFPEKAGTHSTLEAMNVPPMNSRNAKISIAAENPRYT